MKMEYEQLDNLIYTYNQKGRGTGKTTSLIEQAFRLATEGKNVVVVSLNDTFAVQLSFLFSRRYTVSRVPRFVSVETFSSGKYVWDGYTVLVDPDVWVRLLQESASATPNEKEKVWTPSPEFLEVVASRNNKLRDAGLLSHTHEQQELAQWKGIAIAMSNLILKHVK